MKHIRTSAVLTTTILAVIISCSSPEYDVEWKFEIDDGMLYSPALGSDGTIYLSSNGSGYSPNQINDHLYALNPDGSLKWDYPTESWSFSAPAIGPDGTIYWGSRDGYLYALEPGGALKWRVATDVGDCVLYTPAIGSDGTIYVGANDGYLYAFDSDGSIMWQYQNASSPVIDQNGTLYCVWNDTAEFNEENSVIVALNHEGGLEWEFNVEKGDLSLPVIGDDGTLYFSVSPFIRFTDEDTSYFCALDPDGDMLWEYPLSGKFTNHPAIGIDGIIYIGAEEIDGNLSKYYLYAISSQGKLKWKSDQELTPYIPSPTIGSDGTIYVGSSESYLYAIGSDGVLKWKYKAKKDSWVYSPVIDSDGTLYFGTDKGYLYALATESYGLAPSSWPKWGHDNQNTGRAH